MIERYPAGNGASSETYVAQYVVINPGRLAATALLCVATAACTSSRVVSPLAFEHAEKGPADLVTKSEEASKKAQEKADKLQTVTSLRSSLSSTPSRTEVFKAADDKKQNLSTQERTDLALGQAFDKQAEEYANAGKSLAEAEVTGDDIFAQGLSFSIQPMVAFRGSLNSTTPIAALAVNWRFLPEDSDALALQLVLGGAFNPSSTSSDVQAAVGLGLSHPVGRNGAISFGVVRWSDDGDSRGGLYIGVVLGDFGKKSGSN